MYPVSWTGDQKQQRLNVCEEPCQIVSDDATFSSRVTSGDESWSNTQTEQQSSHWESPNSRRPEKRGEEGGMESQGIRSGDQTVHSALYWRLRENVRRLRPELWLQNWWLLHHDNTVSHFLLHQRMFDQKQRDCRPHPPYSLDFAPPPRLLFCFPNWKVGMWSQ
jgi:hypothetical protein